MLEGVAWPAFAVDGAIAMVILIGVADGVRRGGVRANLGFVATVMSIRVALAARGVVSAPFERFVPLSPGLASAVGFLVTVLLLQALLGFVAERLAWWIRAPKSLSVTWWAIDRAAGTVPGAAGAAIVGWLVIGALVTLDRPAGFAAVARQGRLTPILEARLSAIVPGYAELLASTLQARRPTTNFIIEPGPEVAPPRANDGVPDPEAEAMLLALVNRARRAAGVSDVVRDPLLDRAARAHSADMLVRGYFEHVSPSGDPPQTRVREAGYLSERVAENIAFAPTVEEAHLGLMASLHHRATILDATMARVGIGVVVTPGGRMITQAFASAPFAP